MRTRHDYVARDIPGGPKTEQSIQSIFQDFALINIFLFSPCWIEHLFLIILTPRSSNLVENFLFYEKFLMDCHFRDLPDFQSSEARLMTASAVHGQHIPAFNQLQRNLSANDVPGL